MPLFRILPYKDDKEESDVNFPIRISLGWCRHGFVATAKKQNVTSTPPVPTIPLPTLSSVELMGGDQVVDHNDDRLIASETGLGDQQNSKII